MKTRKLPSCYNLIFGDEGEHEKGTSVDIFIYLKNASISLFVYSANEFCP